MIGRHVSYTSLAQIGLTPAHYRAYVRRELETTSTQSFGTLVHAVLLGGDMVVYDGERRGNRWKEFAAAHPGETIVTEPEARRAEAAAEGVRAMLAEIDGGLALLDGDHEVDITWTYRGREARSRIDVLGKDFICDIKTTRSAAPDKFARLARWYHYHAQMAFYGEAASKPDAYLIGFEIKPPYATTVWKLTPRLLAEGRKLCTLWFERLRACEDSDRWPGYSQTILDLDIDESTGDDLILEDAE